MRRSILTRVAGLALVAGSVTAVAVVSTVDAAPTPQAAVSAPQAAVSQHASPFGVSDGPSTFRPLHLWAGSFPDPVHEHHSCSKFTSSLNACQRWILANGAVIQGSANLLIQQSNYVLVWCSSTSGDNVWRKVTVAFGPWGNTGDHIYCLFPIYNGKGWPLTNP